MDIEETFPVTIYGASDDGVVVESPNNQIHDEFDCYDRPCLVEFKAPDGESVIIRGNYGYEGWELSVYEDNSLGWTIEYSRRPGREEDPAIILHVPAGTVAEEFFV